MFYHKLNLFFKFHITVCEDETDNVNEDMTMTMKMRERDRGERVEGVTGSYKERERLGVVKRAIVSQGS